MNRLMLVASAIFATVMLGCNNAKDVGKSNFQRVINDRLKTEKLCADPLKWVLMAGNVDNGYPVAVTLNVPELELFARAGLLTASASMAVPVLTMGPKTPVRATTYDLTEKGKQYYSGPPKHLFCYGAPEATSVTEYTEPADMLGAHITRVTFAVGIRDYADWASDPAIQKRFGTVKPGAKGAAVLELTSNGWKVAEHSIGYSNEASH
jgi:hypothetical protein